MENNDELKEIILENGTCYYLDDIIKIEDFDFDNILLDEKSHENFLIYDISFETLIGEKPLHTRIDKVDEFIRVLDGTRYLVLFGAEKYDFFGNRIRYLIGVKSTITYIFSDNYAK